MILARALRRPVAAGLALALGASLGLCACTTGHGEGSATAPGEPAKPGAPALKNGALRFEAVVHVDDAAGGPQRFLGVFVEQDDGTKWVVTDRAGTPFHNLRDHRVVVEGTPYEPPGQALRMRHLRVTSMKVIRTDDDYGLEEVRGEEAFTGTFEEYEWPEGTKLAGEKAIRFVAANGETFLVAEGDGKRWHGLSVTLHAHRVEPSRVLARPGGPYLWIMDIAAR